LVDIWNRNLKLYAVPWCASSLSSWIEFDETIAPKVKSARAKDFAVKAYSHSLMDIELGLYTPKAGDIRVKTRRGGNHVDVFVEWDKQSKTGVLIGGNVSDKVKLRNVTLKSMIADGTTDIIEVRGNYQYYLSFN
jgi:hypothetical protein